jgi:hypothetical protein
MTSRDKKETRRVSAGFEFEDAGAGRVGWRGRRDRVGDRDQEPPPRGIQNQSPVPTRPNGNTRRREAFGAHLTGDGPSSQTPNDGPAGSSRRPSPSPSPEGVDSVVLEFVRFFFIICRDSSCLL